MLTSALITLAQQAAPDWSRVKIMTYLDELQKMVFSQTATKQMRIYDSSTGKDPILTTLSGTQVYNINTTSGFPQNAWRVYEVYQNIIDEPEENVTSLDATPATPYAQLVFTESISGNYYIRCYRFPTSIGSERTQLEIPAAYHLSHVYEGLIGLIEKDRSGKSDRWEKFQAKLLPELIKRLSDGKVSGNTGVQYRFCGE